MPMKGHAVINKLILLAIFLLSASASSATRFRVDGDGKVLPFQFKDVPLAQFAKEYSEFSGKGLQLMGKWEELNGKVHLFVPRPITREVLAELFHQVLGSNSYAAVDDPSRAWNILRQRDARDAQLQFSDSNHFNPSYRMQTVIFNLKTGYAESVARTMRSFMPANSRIIPVLAKNRIILDAEDNSFHSARDYISDPYIQSLFDAPMKFKGALLR